MSRDIVHSVSDIKYLAEKNNMPLEQMRFFPGTDYREPRAFGVYQDTETGEWVVYKNKDTGERVERYRGFDEEFAAQELWEKMESEMNKRIDKYNGAGSRSNAPATVRHNSPAKKKEDKISALSVAVIIGICVLAIISHYKERKNRHNGYYRHNDSTYYFQGGDWYWFDDDILDWLPYDGVEDEDIWFDNYYYGDSYDFGNYEYDFNNSDYYDADMYYSNDDDDDDWSWGSDNDWDWGGWDAGDTDWGSDW